MIKGLLMQTMTQQQIAAKIVNKMTVELMELTRLSRDECQNILKTQFGQNVKKNRQKAVPAEIINSQESQYINTLFH